MKNTLKRILLLLPVISVLLVALAVPAFADYSPETGWDAPVGTFEPFVAEVFVGDHYETIDIGLPVDIDGYTLNFKYKLVFTEQSFVPSADREVMLSGTFFILNFSGVSPDGVAYDVYMPCDYLSTIPNSTNGLYYHLVESTSDITVTFDQNPVIYSYFYPMGNGYWEPFSFEVYEAASAPSSDSVTSVWTEIMTWITSALNSVMGAFYVDGSLTLLGTLAVIGVSVGIGFLLIGLIQRFLHLRG